MTHSPGVVGGENFSPAPETVIPDTRRRRRAQTHKHSKMKMSRVNQLASLVALLGLICVLAAATASADKNDNHNRLSFTVEHLLSLLEQQESEQARDTQQQFYTNQANRPPVPMRARRAHPLIGENNNNNYFRFPDFNAGPTFQRQSQFNFDQPNKWWHPRQQQDPTAAAASRQQTLSIMEQPPSELLFSNQTGALVHCGVAFELAQGIARANNVHHQRRLAKEEGGSAAPTGAGQQESPAVPAAQMPMIQIRWEKENGDELEKIFYATSDSTSSLDRGVDDSTLSVRSDHNQGEDTRNRPLLRYVRPSDGALIFEPFRASDFRSDVHSTTYRCVAESQVGVSTSPVITMPQQEGENSRQPHTAASSRDMRVRAVIAEPAPAYAIEVLDELALEGNSVTFRCQVPSHASAFLQPVDWIESPGEISHSVQQTRDLLMLTMMSGPSQNQTTQIPAHLLAKLASQRYFVAPKTGDLTILEVDASFNERTYRCRCRNKLTGELVSSTNRGKLVVSESRAPIAPKQVAAGGGGGYHQANNQLGGVASNPQFFDPSTFMPPMRYSSPATPQVLSVGEDEQVALLVCRLQAFPRAQISWFKQVAAGGGQDAQQLTQVPLPVASLQPGDSQQVNQTFNHHASSMKYVQLSNVLLVRYLSRNDSGQYLCLARNVAGEERFAISLQVTGRLRTRLSMSASVLELGKSLALECSVSGWPLYQLVFKHNGQVIKSVSGPDTGLETGTGSRQELQGSNHLFASTKTTSNTNYFVLDDNQGDEDAASTTTSRSVTGSDNQQAGEASALRMSHVIVIVLEPQHAGAYQCFAHNQFESAQSTGYLRVLDDPPSFKETFKSQVHAPGTDVSLHCSARANPLPEITWTIDEQPLASVESAYNRIRFGDFVTRDNLVISYVNISQVQVADGGLYRCTADNRLARVHHEALVQVWGEPLVKPMPNVTVLASTTFRQRCPVAGHPVGEIQWHHNGHRLPANHRQRVHDNGTLEVEHMERSAGDEGEYTCVAMSGGGGPGGSAGDIKSRVTLASSTPEPPDPTSGADRRVGPAGGVASDRHAHTQGSVHVSIRVRPTIEPFAISRQLREGQRASIMCTISSGDLPISITWFLNDQLLLPIGGGGGVTGQVVSSSSGQVAIVGPPSQSSSSAAGNSLKRPSHHPHHHHQPSGAQQLQSDAQISQQQQQLLAGVQISRVSDYSSTLLFESLLARHTGNYTCLARNDAGSVSHSAPMIVQVAPKWSIEPNDTRIVRGRVASIDCMASGFPPPRVIWTKASGDLAPDANGAKQQQVHDSKPSTELIGASASSSSSSSNHLGTWRSIVSSPHLQVFENGSLNILDARDSDHGHYMCQASNGVGPGLSKVIRVVINVAAQFVTPRHAVQYVARGDQAHLKCQARGDWPVALTWFKNGRHKLEPVNAQVDLSGSGRLQHALAVADGPSHLLLASTTASVLASLDNQQQPVANSSRRSGTSDSLAHQFLGAWLGSSSSSANALGQQEASSQGLLMQRYSMASSEHLVAPATTPISMAQLQRLRELAQAQVAERQPQGLAQVSSGGRNDHQLAPPVVVQVSSSLTIDQIERQDMGTYRCLAGNEFGLDERLIQLIVQEPPDRIEELSVLDVQSRSATLGWWAPYDGNAPIQNYHIQYKPAAIGPSGSELANPVSHAHHQRSHTHAHHHQQQDDGGGWLNYTVAATSTTAAAAAAGATGPLEGPPSGGAAVNAHRSAIASGRVLNKITIGSLRPVTHYYFRLEAENKLGRGPSSGIIGTLTLEEAPGAAPGKLKAVAQSSSSILVSWNRLQEREVFGSIHGYYVAYRQVASASSSGSDVAPTNALTGEQQVAGTSAPSLSDQEDLLASTTKQNSTSKSQQQHEATNIYKTIPHDEKLSKFDALLTGLKRSTKYAISVQAFNGRGTGPASEPVVVRTLELDLPRQMKLFVKHATNSSIRLEWRPLSQAALATTTTRQQQQQLSTQADFQNATAAGDVVDYYQLYQAELGAEEPLRWQEARLPGHASSHLIEQLKCGTRYQFYAMGANRIGRGEQSEILDTRTAGGEPMAPDRQSCFDVINTTCYVVRLDRWQDNGCALRRFDVRYRLEPTRDWTHLAHFDLSDPIHTTTMGNTANATTTTSAPRLMFKRDARALDDEQQQQPSDEFSYQDGQAAEQEDELAFVDYPAAPPGEDTENRPADEQLDDYLALEAASLISKTDDSSANKPANAYLSNERPSDTHELFSLLKDSMAPAFSGDELQSHDTLVETTGGRGSIRARAGATTMPQVAQEWQASNFKLEGAVKSLGNLEDDARARSSVKRHPAPAPGMANTNWRRVYLCNLKPEAYYSVQIRAENRVGETEAEYRLLTSPEGLEFDPEIKRHVVSSRLDASSDRMTAGGGTGSGSHSSMVSLLGFNQWPWLVPVSLIMTLITIVIIITLLLKNKSTAPFGNSASGRGTGGGAPSCAGGSSPDSSSASSTTTTTAGNFVGANHNPMGCTLQRPRPEGTYPEQQQLHHHSAPMAHNNSFAPHNQHHHHTLHHPNQRNTNINHHLFHHNTMRQYTSSGRPPVDPSLTGSGSGDLMLASSVAPGTENYATVVAGPARHPASLFANTPANQFEAMSQQQQQFDDSSSVALASVAAANEMALADIYQQRAGANQQAIYGTATNNNHLSSTDGPQLEESSPYGGLILHNMGPATHLSGTSDQTQVTSSSGIQATTGSPSTTAPLSSINSSSSGGQTIDHFHHHMMATTLPAANNQNPGSPRRVYLCASGKDQEEEQQQRAKQSSQETSIFYGMPQLDEQQQHQVDEYAQQNQQDNLGQYFALQQHQGGQQAADDCLAFDPVYATIRRTFPQAFKYLTLQHKSGGATTTAQQHHQ